MKKRKAMKPVFAPYHMGQMLLMPQSYEELMPDGHLVRVVNRAVDQSDVESLVAQFAGGWTSSYHPKMMLKVLVYGYCQKICTSRKIAAALRENIYWLMCKGCVLKWLTSRMEFPIPKLLDHENSTEWILRHFHLKGRGMQGFVPIG